MRVRLSWVLGGVGVAAALTYVFFPRAIAVEYGQPESRTVKAFIAEDGETQLADLHIIDMPVSGRLASLPWEIGDMVEAGDVLARVEDNTIRDQLRGVEALIEQATAQMSGVDVQKPKPEALASAQLHVQEAGDALQMAVSARGVAEIQLEEAERQFGRLQTLLDRGVVSQRDYDEARALRESLKGELARAQAAEERTQKGLEIARLGAAQLEGSVDDNEFMREAYQAQVDHLKTQFETLQRELDKTVIKAPVTGPVLIKLVEAGRSLMAGTPILQIGDLASGEIIVDVLSEEVVHIEEGGPVEIEGKALGGTMVMGSVKRIYPAAFKKISALGIEQQRVRVLVDYDDTAMDVRPGTSLDVRIITGQRDNAVAVPERALFHHEGQWHVFRVRGGAIGPLRWEVAHLEPVVVTVKNDTWAAIDEGLAHDDVIITEPLNTLSSGARVQPKLP
jgi:HlyD family secretion protein